MAAGSSPRVLSHVFSGRRFPGSHGEALQAAHLPPEPPLAVETPGHHEEEAAVLVSPCCPQAGLATPQGHHTGLGRVGRGFSMIFWQMWELPVAPCNDRRNKSPGMKGSAQSWEVGLSQLVTTSRIFLPLQPHQNFPHFWSLHAPPEVFFSISTFLSLLQRRAALQCPARRNGLENLSHPSSTHPLSPKALQELLISW